MLGSFENRYDTLEALFAVDIAYCRVSPINPEEFHRTKRKFETSRDLHDTKSKRVISNSVRAKAGQ